MKKVIVLLMLVCSMTVATKGTLVAHYDFEGNLNDSTSNGWNGAAIGDIGYGTSYYGGNGGSQCLQLTADGKVGGNDGVLITGSENLLNGESSLTIALWYKAALPEDAAPFWDAFVSKVAKNGSGAFDSAGWAAKFSGVAGNLAFKYTTVDGTAYPTTSGKTVNDGEWHHLIFVYASKDKYLPNDGKARGRIYLDGVQVGNDYSHAYTTILSSAVHPITIGVDSDDSVAGGYKNGAYGWIDDVRLYDNWMTTTEAIALYNATIPEPATLCILAVGSLLMVNRKK